MRGVFEFERLRARCPYVSIFGNRTAHHISSADAERRWA